MSEQAIQVPGAPEEGIESDDIDSVALAVWGAVSVLIVVITILVATALYNEYQGQLNQQRIVAPRYVASDEAIITQAGKLTSYAPPSAEGAPYQIPIDQAKQLVLRELQEAQKDQ